MRSSQPSDRNRIDAILRIARRRRALILALEQLPIGIAMVLAGAILVLLVGTQILAWYWLAFLACIGFGLVLLRVRSRPIPPYRLAQILDQRLKLSDSLSTAWFLLSQARGNDPIARFQIDRAEQIAGSVRPAAAFPFVGRRRWAMSATLAAVALSLFTVRYLVTNSLSLKPALVPMHFSPVLEALEKPFVAEEAKPSGPQPSAPSQPAQGQQERDKNSSNNAQPKPGRASEPAGDVTAESTKPASDVTKDVESAQAGASATRNAQSSPERGKEDRDKTSQDAAHTTEQASMQPSAAGLLGKMKDALSSLMAKLRPNASSTQSTPNAERSPQTQKSADQAAAGKEQRGNQQNARSNPSSEQQSTAGQAQGDTSEKSQASQGRNSSSSSEQKNSGKQSGVGRQDGDKQIKEAEQLRAMGKLAEIIGKRSANLTGEMSVETNSGSQQLKTEYSERLGHHSDLGGEIDRDEIPLIYQQYVRDYMQEVRKQPGAASPKVPE